MPLYVNDGDDGFIVYESHCDGNVDDDVNVTLVSDDGFFHRYILWISVVVITIMLESSW